MTNFDIPKIKGFTLINNLFMATHYLRCFLIVLFPVFFLVGNSIADNQQEEEGPWSYRGLFSQQLNQISFTNWARGGEESFASTSLVNLDLDYEKERIQWESRLKMAYGVIKLENLPWRKNEDFMHLTSKLGRKISPKFNTTVLSEFRSQFDKGFKYPNDSVVVSRFMAPGYLQLSLGIDYKPLDYLSIFFSPASGRLIFVRDQRLANEGAYGVRPAEYDQEGNLIRVGETRRAEFGTLLNIRLQKEVLENVQIDSRLSLFNDLTDENRSNRKNTDLDWETGINVKLSQYITASVLVHMIYEHDTPIPVYDEDGMEIGTTRKIQLKQMFGLGLSYSL